MMILARHMGPGSGEDRCHTRNEETWFGVQSMITLDPVGWYASGGGIIYRQGSAEMPSRETLSQPGQRQGGRRGGRRGGSRGGRRGGSRGGSSGGGSGGGSGGPGRRLLRRSDNQTAEDPKAQQCPAKGDHCVKRLIPNVSVYDKTDKRVYKLNSLPPERYDAFQKDVRTGKESQIAIMKAYGAKPVDESKDPEVKAIMSEGNAHGNLTK